MNMTPSQARAAIIAGTAPDNLTVGGYLELSGFPAITSLPDNLTVSGNLYLSGCTDITSLPDNLTVGGSLYLSGCTAITSLPDNLTVGDYLDLGGCTNLISVGGRKIATPDEAKARLRIIADAVAANPNVLYMSSWHHPCGTAHCLAGSAIDNEGAEGYDLEERFGPQAAGAILLGIDTIKMFTVSDARAAEWLKQFETPKALEGVE